MVLNFLKKASKSIEMKTKWALSSLCLSLLVFMSVGNAQTAGSQYPSSTLHYHVKTAWYDMRPNFGGNGLNARIGFQLVETPNNTQPCFFYYFDRSNSASVATANAMYATFLAALSSGEDISVFIKGIDPYSPGTFEISTAQVGRQ